MRKGIFWCTKFDAESTELITVSVVCDKDGDSQEPVQFSSKSGNNFNHRIGWDHLDRKTTEGKSFDYYPRGRVEIKNGKATVFLNPIINKECIVRKITGAFDLMTGELNCISVKSDRSNHYHFTCEGS